PWLQIYFATTGVNSFGARVNGDQQITRQEALRLFTRGNSWFLRMEDKIGSIEPGKLADLAVLNKDYFAVTDAEIKQIRSVLTIVDGGGVHEALYAVPNPSVLIVASLAKRYTGLTAVDGISFEVRENEIVGLL